LIPFEGTLGGERERLILFSTKKEKKTRLGVRKGGSAPAKEKKSFSMEEKGRSFSRKIHIGGKKGGFFAPGISFIKKKGGKAIAGLKGLKTHGTKIYIEKKRREGEGGSAPYQVPKGYFHLFQKKKKEEAHTSFEGRNYLLFGKERRKEGESISQTKRRNFAWYNQPKKGRCRLLQCKKKK